MSSQPRVFLAMAWYRPQDWARLLEISVDRDQLETTHAEWVANANKIIRQLERSGRPCERIVVDLDELLVWCQAHGRPVNGAARSEFACDKARGQSQP